MNIDDAITQRIKSLYQSKNITLNKLATLSGITQSTLNELMKGRTKSPKVSTIKKICLGLDITMSEFFNDPQIEESDVD